MEQFANFAKLSMYPQTIVTFEDKVNVFSTCLATETIMFTHRDKNHSYKDAAGAL